MYGGCRVPAREGVQLSSVLQLSLDSGDWASALSHTHCYSTEKLETVC